MAKMRRPFGLWSSPITAAVLSQAVRLREHAWSADGEWLVWLEEHSGQGILFASDLSGHAPRRLTGEVSVRAPVGYGGGSFTVGRAHLFYVEREGRLYAQPLAHGAARAITPPGLLCSSPALSPDGEWVLFVYEQEGAAGLAVVDTRGRHWPWKLAEGLDFYMHPAWHPNGDALAFVGWSHPHMPWDRSGLYVLPVQWTAEGPRPVKAPQALVQGEESVIQPEFSPDGVALTFLSDREGWWQLYRHSLEGPGAPACLTPQPAEFGGPAWQMGFRWYGWLPDSRELVATRSEAGSVDLVRVEAGEGEPAPLPVAGAAYTTLSQPVVNPADGRVAVHAAAPERPPRLIVLDPRMRESPPAPRIVRRSAPEQLDPEDLADIRPIAWQNGAGETVHGLLAEPASSRFTGEGAPPLVVQVHGGPTSQAYRTWRPELQFFTSRGFAFLEVNHRGSSGYGRAYREKLRGQWGVVDVEDVVSGRQYVTDQGWAHPARCAVRGSSAGGYTVLQTLVSHPEAFRAGVCMYGISDLFALARETHKFESHYLDTLVGVLPDEAERYRERSPLFHAERLVTPVIVFQGAEDKVVPPGQSERIVASLRARGVPHEYHLYAGEGHGFRRRETVQACLEATERFLVNHLLYT